MRGDVHVRRHVHIPATTRGTHSDGIPDELCGVPVPENHGLLVLIPEDVGHHVGSELDGFLSDSSQHSGISLPLPNGGRGDSQGTGQSKDIFRIFLLIRDREPLGNGFESSGIEDLTGGKAGFSHG